MTLYNTIALRSSQDMGRLMENLVAVELHRRKSYYGGDDVFYWKDHQQREVDFVLKRGEMVNELIQVSYASWVGRGYQREGVQGSVEGGRGTGVW